MRDKMGPNLGISSPMPRMKHKRTVRRMHRLKQNSVGVKKRERENSLGQRVYLSGSLVKNRELPQDLIINRERGDYGDISNVCLDVLTERKRGQYIKAEV